MVSVAPHSQLVSQAGVQRDLALGDSLGSELLTEERLRRFLVLGLPGVVVVDIRFSMFPV